MRSKRALHAAAPSFPYIDNLFDYGAFLRGASDGIGKLPSSACKRPVVVVGSGIAGLVAAYELMRAGAQNVSIFEATNRFGGRVYSLPFSGSRPEFLAELGAMRFPPSEFGLFHYLHQFRIPYSPDFPDPGKVSTNIGYQGQTYHWPAGKPPPPLFHTVNAGWSAFVSEGVDVPGKSRLLGPAEITSLLTHGKLSEAQKAWQAYLDDFENLSFFSGLKRIFTGANPPGGKPWTVSDFELFGALGLGSGGFGPLYQIGFVELLRLIVNELETDQQFVRGGIHTLAAAFVRAKIHGVELGSRVRLGAEVRAIQHGANPQEPIELTLGNGQRFNFARAVVATSNRAMQIDMGLTQNLGFLDPNQYSALDGVHMTSSSKVFVMTKDKFWLTNPGLPANIQTDTLVRGVYCLDYTPGKLHDPGVVLLSYTWEDDSVKQMAMSDKRARVKRLVADVAQTNASFASHLVPIDNDYDTYAQMVDWDLEPHYYGAFKLNYPGNDGWSNELFFQYLSCQHPEQDKFLYLAGDSMSYTGGWIEGAVQTGVNAACAVIRSLGGSLYTSVNPVDTQNPKAYNYYR
jgi:tryptophan 2-monooxygenase